MRVVDLSKTSPQWYIGTRAAHTDQPMLPLVWILTGVYLLQPESQCKVRKLRRTLPDLRSQRRLWGQQLRSCWYWEAASYSGLCHWAAGTASLKTAGDGTLYLTEDFFHAEAMGFGFFFLPAPTETYLLFGYCFNGLSRHMLVTQQFSFSPLWTNFLWLGTKCRF